MRIQAGLDSDIAMAFDECHRLSGERRPGRGVDAVIHALGSQIEEQL